MDEESKRSKIQKGLWIASLLVAYAGLIGFTCFIFEESLQLQIFTASIYINAGDWNGLENHVKLMEKTQITAEFWIKCFGWGNPIMWPAFLSYVDSNDAYIKSLKARLEKEKA